MLSAILCLLYFQVPLQTAPLSSPIPRPPELPVGIPRLPELPVGIPRPPELPVGIPRLSELPVGIAGCRPYMPSVRGSISQPALHPFQLPVSRLPCRPPVEQCFRPTACRQPVFGPPPVPEQYPQFRDVSLSEPRFPHPPPMIVPFQPPFQSFAADAASHGFPRMDYQPVVSSIRQTFLPPPSQHAHSLIGLPMPQASQLSAAVVSVESSRESAFIKQAAVNQPTESSAVSESVDASSRPMFTNFDRNQDVISQKSSERRDSSSSSTRVSHDDDRKKQSRWKERKRSPSPPRSRKSSHSRDSSSDRDSRKDTRKQHVSRLENQ